MMANLKLPPGVILSTVQGRNRFGAKTNLEAEFKRGSCVLPQLLIITFRNLKSKIYDFPKFDFSHFTPHVRLIFVEKGNLKFSDSKI